MAHPCRTPQIGEPPPLPRTNSQVLLAYGLGDAVSVALESAALAKRALLRLLPQRAIEMIHQTIGMIDYIRSPDRGAGWGQGRLWFQTTSGQRYRRISCRFFILPLPPLPIIHPLRWLLQAWLPQAGCAGAALFSQRKLITDRF